MTDNEIIARFMGVYQDNPEYFKNSYESSWDWLMPVCTRIEDILSKPGASNMQGWVHWNDCFNGEVNTDRQVTYNIVVEFIKWYNSQNP